MPISLQQSQVEKRGLEFDRLWCIFDKNEQALTARKFPQILDIEAKVSEKDLLICYRDKTVGRIPLTMSPAGSKLVKVFSYDAEAVSTSEAFERQVLAKHGGAPGDVVGFADQCPILLTNEASLADLNRRLKRPIMMNRFRPNLVVNGTDAWVEDNWQLIRIGECEFKVNQPCIRCVFTTIDPVSKSKDPDTEPLRTMRTFRKGPKGGVVFGMHITPINAGIVRLKDPLEVLK